MGAARYLTLVWPGLPWLWLRGSLSGLVLALAFAVALDVAVLTTWIWSDLVSLRLTIALWTAIAAIWLVSTASAFSAFPSAIPQVRSEAAEALFLKARNSYLARDWLAAETHLRTLLDLAPTDGEAQLLWGTLLRRVGRPKEAREALEKLARSDSGARWRTAIGRELAVLGSAGRADDRMGESPIGPAILPLHQDSSPAAGRSAAA
jgi:hypothetical protein